MSTPSQPQPPSPQESAEAAVQAAQAGDVYQVANAPVQGYADLYTQAMLDPARAQLQSAVAAQSALQGAQAQQAIQSQVDPMAYQIRQMNLKAASSRLGQLYGLDPSAFSYTAPAAFATPTPAALPSLQSLASGGQAIGQQLANVYWTGGRYVAGGPSGTAAIPGTGAGTATSAIPSYLGIRT